MHNPLLSRRDWLQFGSLAVLPVLAETLCGPEPGNEIIKLIYVLRRKAGLSIEQFHDYWFNKHAALVRKYAKQTRILRYTQSHTLADQEKRSVLGDVSDGRPERGITETPYDGVAELWWRIADLAVFAQPIGQEAATKWMKDEENFIDIKRSNTWISREHVIVGSV